MDKEKLVSVILSTYNSEDTLEESINSILNQTYLDIYEKISLYVWKI